MRSKCNLANLDPFLEDVSVKLSTAEYLLIRLTVAQSPERNDICSRSKSNPDFFGLGGLTCGVPGQSRKDQQDKRENQEVFQNASPNMFLP
jgi:hypothetical protein